MRNFLILGVVIAAAVILVILIANLLFLSDILSSQGFEPSLGMCCQPKLIEVNSVTSVFCPQVVRDRSPVRYSLLPEKALPPGDFLCFLDVWMCQQFLICMSPRLTALYH